MSRRYRPEKRDIEPDLKFDNIHVSMFVNRLMYDGKKSVAQTLIYDSFDMIEERVGRPGVEVFEHCLLYTSPSPRDRTRSRMPSSA